MSRSLYKYTLPINQYQNSTPRGQRTIPSIVNSILSTAKPYEPPSDYLAVKKLLVDFAVHIKSLDREISDLRQQLQQSPPNRETVLASRTPSIQSRFDFISPPVNFGVSSGSYLDDIHGVESLSADLRTLSVEHPKDRHFGGLSSNMLLKLVIDIKEENTEEDLGNTSNTIAQTEARNTLQSDYKRPEFWTILPVGQC